MSRGPGKMASPTETSCHGSLPVPEDGSADKLAREIESGTSYTEVEGEGADGDEEARYSAAQPMGGKALKPLPQVPERPGQDIALQDRSGRRGMISEMKRINALNLEPTSAKHDETNARSRMSMKDSTNRNAQRLQGNSQDLKSEFQQSLEIIAQQDAKKRSRNNEGNPPMEQNAQNQKSQSGAMAKAGDQSRGGQNSSFSFNPKAPSFTLNPQAGEFMPSAPGGGQTPAKASATSPSFSTYKNTKASKPFKGGLVEILDCFFQRAKNSNPDSAAPDWPDAKGPSYKDVLGQPNQSGQAKVAGAAGGIPMQNMAGPWAAQGQHAQGGQQVPQQQQQPVQQQTAPPSQDQQTGPNMVGQGGVPMQPMMPGGFVVANAPPGQGGQTNTMQYGNMYAAGQQGQHQQQGMQQPAILFNQTPVMGQSGSQMVPMIAQGQQGQMGVTAPMAKFGGQQQQMVVVPMMLASGQYGNGQGFMPATMQGQGTMPPGPPQGDGGQGQMMQQGMGYARQQ
ncbi:unnamed protein product [Effrenium voratum]|nr:unnamed protein product [Effrenium voratum]